MRAEHQGCYQRGSAIQRGLRKLVPSVAILAQKPLLMAPLDAVDWLISLPFPEFRTLPPNHMRLRVGLGNKLLFNQARFLEDGGQALFALMSQEFLTSTSNVVDIGCGCGRFALALQRFGFAGRYTGIDVDREMLAWCIQHFPNHHFRFHHADTFSRTYNPGGVHRRYTLPLEEGGQDLVYGNSVLSHLLEAELRNYLSEGFRVLRPAGSLVMTVFCIDDMRNLNVLGGRWTFKHRRGNAHVEDESFPEAAVAYERAYLCDVAESIGFRSTQITAQAPQSLVICVK